jgi:hypothetical protein
MAYTERERKIAMMRAALPYTSGRGRHALDLLLQADALLGTIRGGVSDELEACETQGDSEEMLLQMQEFCTPKESDFIQMILNFRKADHIFRNYREFVSSKHTEENQTDLHAAELGGSGQIMEFLMSQLSPEQRQLFEQFKSFSTETQGKDTSHDQFETE